MTLGHGAAAERLLRLLLLRMAQYLLALAVSVSFLLSPPASSLTSQSTTSLTTSLLSCPFMLEPTTQLRRGAARWSPAARRARLRT